MSGTHSTDDSLDANLAAVKRLVEIVAELRHPETGCPWDLAQTAESLIPHVIEEAYETVDAIRSGDRDAMAEELGDLLLQVVLQAQVAKDNRAFSLTEVANTISDKLVRRHPHVFGDVQVNDVQEVRQNWEQIKAQEKGETNADNQKLSKKLSRYARTLPPLRGSMKISQKAATTGFEWDDANGIWEKFQEELQEFQQALAQESSHRQQEELGDLLFAIVNLARWYGLDPSEALQETNHRFVRRFAQVESLADKPMDSYSIEELEAFWQQAKKYLKSQQ